MRLALKAVAVLAAVYLLAVAGLFAAMHQPPERFSRIMAKMPGPMFVVLPFRPLWMAARGGSLQVGDPAPDFNLETFDRTSKVRLASFRGEKPVVLVFGSYT